MESLATDSSLWPLITSISLGIGLAACCGFRVFVPLLVTNISYLAGYATPSVGFEWMGTWGAFALLATATVIEIIAYYVPLLDNLLDHLATPAAFIAGTLLMTSLLPESQPIAKWALGLILGGGSAGVIQVGTHLLRLGSTATTGGIGNPIVATAENGLSIFLSILALLLPILVAIGMIFFIFWLIKRLVAKK
ncbi:MAG: DUF4126 domain-containing protein [Spirosomataceae bacterium]